MKIKIYILKESIKVDTPNKHYFYVHKIKMFVFRSRMLRFKTKLENKNKNKVVSYYYISDYIYL